MSKSKLIVGSVIIAAVLGVVILAPSRASAAGALCSANPSTVVVGEAIHIVCDGFDPNVYVNSYVVEATGFSEVGRYNYSVCMVGQNSDVSGSAKANETGTASFTWYTQDGKNSCPISNFDGYANQLGSYTVVIQQLGSKSSVKYVGTVSVTITGNGTTYSGALVGTDGPGISGHNLTVYGSGFGPNEYVNVWFTRPGNCSGLGDWYYTGVSAFDPSGWGGAGITGAGSVKTDSAGNFTVSYLLSDTGGTYPPGAFPCLGTWHVTAHALGSGRGAEAEFRITGNSVTENAKVWTDEARVPSYGQQYGLFCSYGCGIAVHVNGSGFPAGAVVNCWFTRPDGTVYNGYSASQYGDSTAGVVGADGTFSGFSMTYSSETTYQGEQPGTWAITCGTKDSKYVGIAHFVVYPLPLIDP